MSLARNQIQRSFFFCSVNIYHAENLHGSQNMFMANAEGLIVSRWITPSFGFEMMWGIIINNKVNVFLLNGVLKNENRLSM